jgi:hypothetical protein
MMPLQIFPDWDGSLERETMVGLGRLRQIWLRLLVVEVGVLLLKATGAASFMFLLLACKCLFLSGDVLAVNGMNVEWSWDRRTRTTIKVHEGKELNWTEFRRHENKVVCKMLK